MPSIFSKIISKEIPCHLIAENEDFIAFLDIMPLRMGHVLVVPKIEHDYIFDSSEDILKSILIFAKPIALAIEKNIPCKRIGVSVIGLEVPHVHLHLVPIDSADDLNFTRDKLSPSKNELEELAQKIRISLSQLH